MESRACQTCKLKSPKSKDNRVAHSVGQLRVDPKSVQKASKKRPKSHQQIVSKIVFQNLQNHPPESPKWSPKSTSELYFSRFVFRANFASILALNLELFWHQTWSSEALGSEKATFRKPMFYLSKTILFEVWASPGTTKSTPETPSKFDSENHRF